MSQKTKYNNLFRLSRFQFLKFPKHYSYTCSNFANSSSPLPDCYLSTFQSAGFHFQIGNIIVPQRFNFHLRNISFSFPQTHPFILPWFHFVFPVSQTKLSNCVNDYVSMARRVMAAATPPQVMTPYKFRSRQQLSMWWLGRRIMAVNRFQDSDQQMGLHFTMTPQQTRTGHFSFF